jgi:predicted nucleic acid-binding Zn ribbon protein
VALERLGADLAPPTTLARVQERWVDVAGATVAAEASPVSERGGVVTVACRSAVWAQELDLLSGDLVRGLNQALGGGGPDPPVRGLRFVSGGLSAGAR